LLDELFGVVFMLAGTALLFYVLLQLGRAYQSRRWLAMSGTVLFTSIRRHRGRGVGYEPVVRYRYEWDGLAYEGDRLVFSAISVTGSLDDAEQLLKQFPVGSQIPIRVCSTKRQLSVIKPGFEPAWWIPLAFSILSIMGGFSLWNKP
jgi:hypothetical protein